MILPAYVNLGADADWPAKLQTIWDVQLNCAAARVTFTLARKYAVSDWSPFNIGARRSTGNVSVSTLVNVAVNCGARPQLVARGDAFKYSLMKSYYSKKPDDAAIL